MKKYAGHEIFDRGSTKDDGFHPGLSHAYGRDIEDWPSHEGMRKRRGYVSQHDHIQPLVRFLRKRRNRPWVNVWSEICAVNSNSSLAGYHLRQHCKQYVEGPWSPPRRSYFYAGPTFWVDDKGYLRYQDPRKFKI